MAKAQINFDSLGGGTTLELTATNYNFNRSAADTRTINNLEVGKEYVIIICTGYDSSAVNISSTTGLDSIEDLGNNVSTDPTYSRYTSWRVIKAVASSTTATITFSWSHASYYICVVGMQEAS